MRLQSAPFATYAFDGPDQDASRVTYRTARAGPEKRNGSGRSEHHTGERRRARHIPRDEKPITSPTGVKEVNSKRSDRAYEDIGACDLAKHNVTGRFWGWSCKGARSGQVPAAIPTRAHTRAASDCKRASAFPRQHQDPDLLSREDEITHRICNANAHIEMPAWQTPIKAADLPNDDDQHSAHTHVKPPDASHQKCDAHRRPEGPCYLRQQQQQISQPRMIDLPFQQARRDARRRSGEHTSGRKFELARLGQGARQPAGSYKQRPSTHPRNALEVKAQEQDPSQTKVTPPKSNLKPQTSEALMRHNCRRTAPTIIRAGPRRHEEAGFPRKATASTEIDSKEMARRCASGLQKELQGAKVASIRRDGVLVSGSRCHA
ncbi:uncharacterized protein LAESUDRAFT_713825 [Laetiporus sulphureus 93-53]|uniref:Uncharacterized protein n=1 Tax=Laetiporus sulphureus 93-53 TaxID=1314785 RepID=A0A165EG51_9APHY|nr:uncharacterized protein LAESUDRAFT_713825 [Laetiporus sulphureus 93-53]KZT06989.1 hypothetical protein LAESUDRAFT_713825 [Laetiporus sulphureus 93-53]